MPTLTDLPIPDTVRGRPLRDWERRDILGRRLRLSNPSETEWRGAVLYWRSNGAVVPPDVFDDACVARPVGQQAARDAEVAAFTAEYRRLNANRQPSDEERAEARAAHGPGVTLVNVLTGRRWTT